MGADQTADFICSEWKEIVRVMRIVRDEGFEDTLPEGGGVKVIGTPPMAMFEFGGVTYSREPLTRQVVEMEAVGGMLRTRTFAPDDGTETLAFDSPLAAPEWN